jgi:hypothetical protein
MCVASPGRTWGPRSTRAFRHSSAFFRVGHVSLVSPGLRFFINPHMRPQEPHAISSVGPAQGALLGKRMTLSHWLQILVAAAGFTLFSSVAGLFVYDWYFDSVLAGLASSLQPFSSAFHQLNGDRVRPTPSQPAN